MVKSSLTVKYFRNPELNGRIQPIKNLEKGNKTEYIMYDVFCFVLGSWFLIYS